MLIVIGGQSRSVGKTSVVAGLIAALPQYRWTAFKISPHRHGDDHGKGWTICGEADPTGDSDTSRFLAAGAVNTWWIRAEPENLAEAVPTIQKKIAEAQNAIIESNSILRFINPDLYLVILDPSLADFKKSAAEFLDRADAFIIRERNEQEITAGWREISAGLAKPVFGIRPPRYITPEIVQFVREKLRALNPRLA